MNKYTQIARTLRKNQTPQEAKLWSVLRNKQFKNLTFRRQFPIGKYIVDFICRKKRIIIELDGGQHNTKQIIDYDKIRTEYLISKGYKVLRFWNNDIDINLEGVLSDIEDNLD